MNLKWLVFKEGFYTLIVTKCRVLRLCFPYDSCSSFPLVAPFPTFDAEIPEALSLRLLSFQASSLFLM